MNQNSYNTVSLPVRLIVCDDVRYGLGFLLICEWECVWDGGYFLMCCLCILLIVPIEIADDTIEFGGHMVWYDAAWYGDWWNFVVGGALYTTGCLTLFPLHKPAMRGPIAHALANTPINNSKKECVMNSHSGALVADTGSGDGSGKFNQLSLFPNW